MRLMFLKALGITDSGGVSMVELDISECYCRSMSLAPSANQTLPRILLQVQKMVTVFVRQLPQLSQGYPKRAPAANTDVGHVSSHYMSSGRLGSLFRSIDWGWLASERNESLSDKHMKLVAG